MIKNKFHPPRASTQLTIYIFEWVWVSTHTGLQDSASPTEMHKNDMKEEYDKINSFIIFS